MGRGAWRQVAAIRRAAEVGTGALGEHGLAEAAGHPPQHPYGCSRPCAGRCRGPRAAAAQTAAGCGAGTLPPVRLMCQALARVTEIEGCGTKGTCPSTSSSSRPRRGQMGTFYWPETETCGGTTVGPWPTHLSTPAPCVSFPSAPCSRVTVVARAVLPRPLLPRASPAWCHPSAQSPVHLGHPRCRLLGCRRRRGRQQGGHPRLAGTCRARCLVGRRARWCETFILFFCCCSSPLVLDCCVPRAQHHRVCPPHHRPLH